MTVEINNAAFFRLSALLASLHYEKGFVRFAEKAARQKFYEGQAICARRKEGRKEKRSWGGEGRAKVGIKGGAGGQRRRLPPLAFQSGLSVAVVRSRRHCFANGNSFVVLTFIRNIKKVRGVLAQLRPEADRPRMIL